MKLSFSSEKVITSVEEQVEEIFNNKSLPDCEMHLLTQQGMSAAVSAYAQKDDKLAISNMIE